MPNNSLLIRNVQKSDFGNYYCTCNNTIKKTVSSLVRLEIIESKKVELFSMYASSSSTLKLPCKTLVDTNINLNEIDIKWFRLNSKLPANRFQIDSNGSLSLQNLKPNDSGMYLCKINDQSPHIDKIIKLNVIQSSVFFN